MAVDLEAVRRALIEERDSLRDELGRLTAVTRDPGATIGFGKRVGEGTSEAISRIEKVGQADALTGKLTEVERALAALRAGEGHPSVRATTLNLVAYAPTPADVAFTQRALATGVDGRVLVLKADARRAWVDAYEPLTLKPQGTLFEKTGCGDRLLASGSRIAIVCLATGQVAGDDLRGGGAFAIEGALPHLAGAAMADDGTIWVATSDRQLGAIPFGAVALRQLQWPTAWTGTVLPDSVAVANGADSVVFAQTDTDGSWLRVLASNVVAPRMSLRLAGRTEGAPQFGVVVLAPFAYFASGGDVRHVELSTGMLETMTTVGQGATVVAVVDR